jgi:hypothetical protein
MKDFIKSIHIKKSLSDFRESDLFNLISLIIGLYTISRGNYYMIPFTITIGFLLLINPKMMDYKVVNKIHRVSIYIILSPLLFLIFQLIK